MLLNNNFPRPFRMDADMDSLVGVDAVMKTKNKEVRSLKDLDLVKLVTIDGYCEDIPIELIDVGSNVRQDLKLDEEFIESVRKQGILQPVLVTVTKEKTGKLRIRCIAGHRRIAAAKIVGFESVKCVSKPMIGSQVVTAALSENVNRKSLHPLDLAEAFMDLELQGVTRSDMESMFNRDKKTIARFLKMSKWTKETKELIRSYPEFFTSRLLLALASKRLTPYEIEKKIRALIENPPVPKMRDRRSKVSKKLLEDYFQTEKVKKADQEAILKALEYLHILDANIDLEK